jgi:hypothetical protein
MTAPSAQIIGLTALRRDITRLAGDNGPMAAQLRQSGLAVLRPFADVVRSSLPQNTGRLAGDVRTTPNKAGATFTVGRPGALRYAGWIEFGGRRRVPHDSVRPYQSRGRYILPHAIQIPSLALTDYSQGVTKALDGFSWTNAGTAGVHD